MSLRRPGEDERTAGPAATDVAYNWTLLTLDGQHPSIGFGLLLTNQPDIHLFRTRKGSLGILEVLQAPTNIHGVTIRYRPVQSSTNPAALKPVPHE